MCCRSSRPIALSILVGLGSTALGSNLESSTRNLLLSVEGQVERSWRHQFSVGVVKVLVSFYWTGEDSVCERHRSRVTFDLSKKSSVAAVKNFLGSRSLHLNLVWRILIWNCSDRPIRLTQCCTQFGNKTFCSKYFHIISMWMRHYHTKNLNLERFELGTTLS